MKSNGIKIIFFLMLFMAANTLFAGVAQAVDIVASSNVTLSNLGELNHIGCSLTANPTYCTTQTITMPYAVTGTMDISIDIKGHYSIVYVDLPGYGTYSAAYPDYGYADGEYYTWVFHAGVLYQNPSIPVTLNEGDVISVRIGCDDSDERVYSQNFKLMFDINDSGGSTSAGMINTETPVYVGTVPVVGYNISNYNSSLSYFIYLVWPGSDTNNITSSHWENSVWGASGTQIWSGVIWNQIGTWTVQIWSWNKDWSENAVWTKIASQNVSVVSHFTVLNGYFSYPLSASNVVFNNSGPWTLTVNVSQNTTHYIVQLYAPDTWWSGAPPYDQTDPVLGNQTFIENPIGMAPPGYYTAEIFDSDNGLYVNYTMFAVNGFNATTGFNNTYIACSCGASLDYDLYTTLTLLYSSNGTGLLKVTDPENAIFYQSNVASGYGTKNVNLGTTLKNNKLGNYIITLTDAAGLTKTTTVKVFRATVNFAPGWYLSTDKSSYDAGGVVSVSYKMPDNTTSALMVLQDSHATTVFSQSVPYVSGGGMTSIILPSSGYAWGNWYLCLKDTEGTINAVNIIAVNRTADAGSGGSGGDGTTNPIAKMGDNLMWLISLPMFWGLVIWVLAIAAVAKGKQGEDRSKSIELVAVIGAALEAIVGLWEPYTWFVVAIIIIALGSKFYESRKIQFGGD